MADISWVFQRMAQRDRITNDPGMKVFKLGLSPAMRKDVEDILATACEVWKVNPVDFDAAPSDARQRIYRDCQSIARGRGIPADNSSIPDDLSSLPTANKPVASEGYDEFLDDPFVVKTPSKFGAMQIMVERIRQIEEFGYTATHDTVYEEYELVNGAVSFINAAIAVENRTEDMDYPMGAPSMYPWDEDDWDEEDYEDPIKCLRIAGALLAAEIDRRQKG